MPQTLTSNSKKKASTHNVLTFYGGGIESGEKPVSQNN